MSNPFNTLVVKKPSWSKQSLTHEWKSSLNLGYLHPFLCEDINPGETWRCASEVDLKFSPLISPVMHRINLFTNYFYVPWFQIWSQYDDFISGGKDGNLVVVPPYITPNDIINICFFIADYVQAGVSFKNDLDKALFGFKFSIFDYIGIPQRIITAQWNFTEDTWQDEIDDTTHINMLHVMSYVKIYIDYFADQNLQSDWIDYCNQVFESRKEDWLTHNGNLFGILKMYDSDNHNVSEFFVLRQRAWEHDYFTSALPWAQRGEQVQVPLAGTAPVTVYGETDIRVEDLSVDFPGLSHPVFPPVTVEGATWDISRERNNVRVGASTDSQTGLGEFQIRIQQYIDDTPLGEPQWVHARHLFSEEGATYLYKATIDRLEGTADLSQGTSVTINTFRWLERLQMFLEKNARAGARYVEQLMAHWGVRSDDLRLNRPEYLCGSVQPVRIGEVLQTSESTQNSPLAEFAGYAAAGGNMNGFKRRFKYHGVLFGLMCVLPRTNYFQGIRRQFLKTSRYDYAFPEFNHLGEQEIWRGELMVDNNPANVKSTFGYIPRYSEYRFIPSTVHGDFEDSLLYWHMARILDPGVVLNEDFITAAPTERIFANVNPGDAKVWCQVLNKISAVRPISKHAIPSL